MDDDVQEFKNVAGQNPEPKRETDLELEQEIERRNKVEGVENGSTPLPSSDDGQTRGAHDSCQDPYVFEEPIDLGCPPLPTIPIDAFPPWIKDMIQCTGQATETAEDLGAMFALGHLAIVCQKTFDVSMIPGYIEPMNLWVLPSLPSGERKSSVLQRFMQPIYEYEKEQYVALEPLISKRQAVRKVECIRIENLQKSAAKEKDKTLRQELTMEAHHLEQDLPPVPSHLKLIADDATPEALAVLLYKNKETMSIVSSEGGIFDMLAGRYNNNVPNLDLMLKSYSGESCRIDRKSGDPIALDAPALTLVLSAQPDIMRQLAKKKGFRGSGLLARFLYAFPESRVGSRTNNTESIPEGVLSQYATGIRSLLHMKQTSHDNGVGPPSIRHLEASPQAFQEWRAFQQGVEDLMREGGKLREIRDWGAKLPGQVARIAALLHCANFVIHEAKDSIIQLPAMRNATDIGGALIDHALFAFDLMATDSALDDARKVWGWIERNGQTTFSVRDCQQSLKRTFQRMEHVSAPLQILVERFHVYSIEPEKGKQDNRMSQRYRVSPLLTKGWSNV